MCLFNANFNDVMWKLPALSSDAKWNLLLDSSDKYADDAQAANGAEIKVPAWSVLVFEIKNDNQGDFLWCTICRELPNGWE